MPCERYLQQPTCKRVEPASTGCCRFCRLPSLLRNVAFTTYGRFYRPWALLTPILQHMDARGLTRSFDQIYSGVRHADAKINSQILLRFQFCNNHGSSAPESPPCHSHSQKASVTACLRLVSLLLPNKSEFISALTDQHS